MKELCRAGVWEDNDPSLTVNCYNDPTGGPPRDRASPVVTTTTRTTTTTITTTAPPTANNEDIIDEVFDNEATTFPSLKRSMGFNSFPCISH
jgi:hypothetical protein